MTVFFWENKSRRLFSYADLFPYTKAINTRINNNFQTGDNSSKDSNNALNDDERDISFTSINKTDVMNVDPENNNNNNDRKRVTFSQGSHFDRSPSPEGKDVLPRSMLNIKRKTLFQSIKNVRPSWVVGSDDDLYNYVGFPDEPIVIKRHDLLTLAGFVTDCYTFVPCIIDTYLKKFNVTILAPGNAQRTFMVTWHGKEDSEMYADTFVGHKQTIWLAPPEDSYATTGMSWTDNNDAIVSIYSDAFKLNSMIETGGKERNVEVRITLSLESSEGTTLNYVTGCFDVPRVGLMFAPLSLDTIHPLVPDAGVYACEGQWVGLVQEKVQLPLRDYITLFPNSNVYKPLQFNENEINNDKTMPSLLDEKDDW